MGSVAVITDTDSSIPPDLAAEHGIQQVPILIQFGEETFKADVEIDDYETFLRVDDEGVLPTTSAPPPGLFQEAYEQAFSADADSILCFCVSSVVSGTYNAALVAAEAFEGRDITVVDTRQLSMSQGFMALAAAEAVSADASKAEALAVAQSVGARSHLFAALSTLKYLAMSGRVGHVAAGMANLLSLKPILTIRDGTLDLLEKVRTSRRATARVVELAAEALGNRSMERLALVHVNALDEVRELGEQLGSRVSLPAEVIEADLGPGLSIHGGTGMIGFAFVAAEP